MAHYPIEHTIQSKIIYCSSGGERAELIEAAKSYLIGGNRLICIRALSMELFCYYPELYLQQTRFLSGSAGPIGWSHVFPTIVTRKTLRQ